MSVVVKVLGSGGCCDCATQNGCNCGPACSLSCRSKGGIAELIGCNEFVVQSVPPKKYRRLEKSGSATTRFYNAFANCEEENFITSTTCSDDGWIQYDKDTGATTTGGSAQCDGVTLATGAACMGRPADSCDAEWSGTQSHAERHTTDACCPWTLNRSQKETADTVAIDLTDEDTEDDAIARIMPEDWGAPGTCAINSSLRTQRLAGQFTFLIRVAQVRVTIGSGSAPLTVGHVYEATISFGARIAGSSGPFLPHSVAVVSLLADATTRTSDWIDVPSEEGFEIRALSCTFEDVT